MIPGIRSAYLAHIDYEPQLVREIPGIIGKHGRLLFSKEPAIESMWAQNTWISPTVVEFQSVKDASEILKSHGALWCPLFVDHHRRMQLIVEKLPFFTERRAKFLVSPPKNPLGSFTLLQKNMLLFSAQCSSHRPHGAWEFEEDKIHPPNRAYLKLWEFFTRFERFPSPDSTCLELGASPGGWTWVLAKLAKKVITYDRAPLDPKVGSLQNVEEKMGNAFSTVPEDYPEVDWVFSDVICYPAKLLEWVSRWLENEKKRNFVCTIKLQAPLHYDVIKEFAKIPESKVVHLYHNKHELTWFLIRS